MIFNQKKSLTLLSLQNQVPTASTSAPALWKDSPPSPLRVTPTPRPIPQAVAIEADAKGKNYDAEFARVFDALQQLLHSEFKDDDPEIAGNQEKELEGILLPKARSAAAGRSGK
jgi:hypothetical protein